MVFKYGKRLKFNKKKEKINYEKMIAFIISIALLIAMFPLNALNISAIDFENISSSELSLDRENKYNKIHFYIDEKEHTVIDDKSELTEAVNALTEKNSNIRKNGTETTESLDEKIQVTVEFESDFMETETYKAFSKEREQLKSSDEILEFRKRLTSYSEEYHNKLLDNNIDVLKNFDYQTIEKVKYSPFVVMDVKLSDIKKENLEILCDSEKIENISIDYAPTANTNGSWAQTLDGINAYDIVTDETYTGEGVRIGIYEWGGVCDTSHLNLVGKDVTIRDSSVNVSEHATLVTSVIALMAPDAEIYVSDVQPVVGLSWFIDNYCDIVNCSFSYYYSKSNGDGTYSEGINEYRYNIDAVYDYQIKAHFFTVCVSAGNKRTDNTNEHYNPNGKIESPGYAYNVITVGGVDLQSVNSATGWMHADGACYISSTPIVKPNISAPYTVNTPNVGTASGTSISSPLVAASIALLEDRTSSYKMYPERVMSVLVSTAQKTYDYEETAGAFDEKVGAGIVDLEAIINSNLYYLKENTNKVAQTEIIRQELYLVPGDKVEIGLSWLVTADSVQKTVYVTDYDLRLIGPSENIVANSSLTQSNNEMIRFTISQEGIYTIVVYQYSEMNINVNSDWIALTYNVDYVET